MDKMFIEQMQKKIEKQLADKESSTTEYWKQEIEQILHKQTTSLSSLQQEMNSLCLRMDNRVKTIKKSSEF